MATSWQSEETKKYLENAMQYSPDNYQSKYNLDDLYSKYANYGDFNFDYDQNTDKLYQDYKQRYTDLGTKAMKDTIGQASAMTGGFGNSYATVAGNEAYGDYMSALADKGEALRQQAYNEQYANWQNGKNDALNAYNLALQADANDRNNWNANAAYWQGLYNDSNANDYNQYQFNEQVRQYNQSRQDSLNTAAANAYKDIDTKMYDEALEAYSSGKIDQFYDKYVGTYGQANMDKILDYVGSYGKTSPSSSGSIIKDVSERLKHTNSGFFKQFLYAIENKDTDIIYDAHNKGIIDDKEYDAIMKQIKQAKSK